MNSQSKKGWRGASGNKRVSWGSTDIRQIPADNIGRKTVRKSKGRNPSLPPADSEVQSNLDESASDSEDSDSESLDSDSDPDADRVLYDVAPQCSYGKDENAPGNKRPPSATRGTKRKKQKQNEDVSFPVKSDDPYEWVTTAREEKAMPFTPDRTPGCHGPNISSDQSPGVLFATIMNESLLVVLSETNKYGRSRYESGEFNYKWVDITKEELLVYMGLLIAMGGCVKSNYKSVCPSNKVTYNYENALQRLLGR